MMAAGTSSASSSCPPSSSCGKYNYVAEPDDELKCLICLDVAEDPLQHEECGKLFCKTCIEKHGKNKPCPHCRKQGSKFYQDKRSRRNVLALQVKCSDISGKCEWKGTVSEMEIHTSTCNFALVSCPKECKGSDGRVKHLVKEAVSKHLKKDCPNRDYKCRRCGEKDSYANITKLHDKACKMKVLPCPNADCSKAVQRRNVKRHLDTCKHTEIPCKYRRLGCRAKMKRDAIAAHEVNEDKLHLHLALDAVVNFDETVWRVEYATDRLHDFVERIEDTLDRFQERLSESLDNYH